MSELSITASTVQQLLIRGVPRLDPVRVMLEDFDEGQGRITITCWDSAWGNYWGAMGKRTMAEFFSKASVSYLAGKMKTGLPDTVCDETALDEGCRKEIIKQRRTRGLDKDDARELWEGVEGAYFDAPVSDNSDLFYDIFGDEWWNALPQRPNPDYVYLCKIIEAVKEGLRLHAEQSASATI
jgi:hypothetical protein